MFTNDVDRARKVAGQLRSGTVGHNAFRTDFGVSFGGFKQSGIGREGIHEGLPHFLETKFVILEGRPPATRTPFCKACRTAASWPRHRGTRGEARTARDQHLASRGACLPGKASPFRHRAAPLTGTMCTGWNRHNFTWVRLYGTAAPATSMWQRGGGDAPVNNLMVRSQLAAR